MLSRLSPRLESLSEAQRRLWPALRAVPRRFVLYGGTALCLRYAHRESFDFDFFATEPFQVEQLLAECPLFQKAEQLQAKANTLTVVAEGGQPAKISFFGGLSLGRVGEPELTRDEVLWVASSLDLAATKMAVIQQRAERKDYLDVAELLRAGMGLAEALGAAKALYGETFNPMISLKALCYFHDGDLPQLPSATKDFLCAAASHVTTLPAIHRKSDRIGCELEPR